MIVADANAPQHTSNVSEAQAKAKQEALAREKQKQDAINSGTVAIDFEHSSGAPATATMAPPAAETPQGKATTDMAGGAESGQPTTAQTKATAKTDPMGPYQFDQYQGQLYRVFEGTVLEGVVTNHIDGGFSGPILVMLTTDYYSHLPAALAAGSLQLTAARTGIRRRLCSRPRRGRISPER